MTPISTKSFQSENPRAENLSLLSGSAVENSRSPLSSFNHFRESISESLIYYKNKSAPKSKPKEKIILNTFSKVVRKFEGDLKREQKKLDADLKILHFQLRLASFAPPSPHHHPLVNGKNEEENNDGRRSPPSYFQIHSKEFKEEKKKKFEKNKEEKKKSEKKDEEKGKEKKKNTGEKEKNSREKRNRSRPKKESTPG
uniref:Uncharacterized protein n=1 Tax=Strongyloides venezuelensis TaxID=75913 RepID=A0A0K0F3A5_STRVS